jgi:ubiquitin carboxyl-terminal hydrolase 8
MQNGYPNNDETVANIKERAKERASSVTKTKGISANSLMRVAQDLSFDAQKAEDLGDLKKSLGLWVQASSLLAALFDTADYKAEAQPGKRGVVYKEVNEWMQVSALVVLCFEWSGGRNPRSTSRATRKVLSTRRTTLNPS